MAALKLTGKTIRRLKSKYGNWVLITGATSGIGKELALKFGEAGFNLVLTGRRVTLLDELCTYLFDHYQVEAISAPGDLSKKEGVLSLIRNMDHLPIGIAVLNAGYATSGAFAQSDIESQVNMLDVNCEALLRLTHYFAQKMTATKQGAIVLMSSMLAFQGAPNAAHYAATKAYVQSLGEGLALELKPKGVDVLCAAPGPVESGFAERADMQMGKSMKPEDVGVPIIRAIGKKTTVLPGFLTKFLIYNLRLTPKWARIRIMGMVMESFTKHQAHTPQPQS
jgi:short-subunit dehydrogenase